MDEEQEHTRRDYSGLPVDFWGFSSGISRRQKLNLPEFDGEYKGDVFMG